MEETWGHIFRECFHARAIWTDLLTPSRAERFWNDEVGTWMQKNLDDKSINERGTPWNITFGVACWMLWKDMNGRVFDKQWIPRLSSKIRILAEHYHKSLELLTQSSPKPPRTINYYSWKKPNDPFIKINTDRSVHHEGMSATARGIVRNHNGDWPLGFMANLVDVTSSRLNCGQSTKVYYLLGTTTGNTLWWRVTQS